MLHTKIEECYTFIEVKIVGWIFITVDMRRANLGRVVYEFPEFDATEEGKFSPILCSQVSDKCALKTHLTMS